MPRPRCSPRPAASPAPTASRVELSLLRILGPLFDACDAALATLDDGGEAISYANPSSAESLDNTSASDLLTSWGLEETATRFADVYTSSEYGLDSSVQSSLNLLFLFGGTETGADQRYKIEGGNDQVPSLLAALYEDRLHLSMALTAVSQASNGTYTLSFADGSTVDADLVVLALPFTLLREVEISVALPDAKTLAIQTLGYGTNAKLLLPGVCPPPSPTTASLSATTDATAPWVRTCCSTALR